MNKNANPDVDDKTNQEGSSLNKKSSLGSLYLKIVTWTILSWVLESIVVEDYDSSYSKQVIDKEEVI